MVIDRRLSAIVTMNCIKFYLIQSHKHQQRFTVFNIIFFFHYFSFSIDVNISLHVNQHNQPLSVFPSYIRDPNSPVSLLFFSLAVSTRTTFITL